MWSFFNNQLSPHHFLQTEADYDHLYVMDKAGISGNRSGDVRTFNVSDVYAVNMRFETDRSDQRNGFRIGFLFW